MRKIRKYRREIIDRGPLWGLGEGPPIAIRVLLFCGHTKRYPTTHVPKRWVYCDTCYARRPGIGPT